MLDPLEYLMPDGGWKAKLFVVEFPAPENSDVRSLKKKTKNQSKNEQKKMVKKTGQIEIGTSVVI